MIPKEIIIFAVFAGIALYVILMYRYLNKKDRY